jgi:hypothetical protein
VFSGLYKKKAFSSQCTDHQFSKKRLQRDGRHREFRVFSGLQLYGTGSCTRNCTAVQDLRLWWKSKTLAYFQETLLTPGFYLVLNFSNILIQYYFKIRIITLLHSVPCLVCHLATLSFAEIMVASKRDK